MATRTGATAAISDTDANFRLWINEHHNALVAMGWVQTSDTGQVNYSTVLKPTGVSVFMGFAVYRMDDSLQSTCPVYLRLDYGAGSSSATTPAIKIQICVGGTDGAGNLTGNRSTQITTSTTITPVSALFNVRTSGSTSSLRMMHWMATTGTNGWLIAIERDRDSTGAETALGVNFVFIYESSSNATQKFSQFLATDGSTGTQDTVVYGMISQNTTQTADGVVGIGPVHCQLGTFRQPMLGLFLCSRTDFNMEQTYSVAIYGTTHTYMLLRPNAGNITPSLNGVNADTGFGMLWE